MTTCTAVNAVEHVHGFAREGDVAAIPALLARVAGISPIAGQRLLAHYGSLGALRRVEVSTLCAAHGLTERQATHLRDALDLATGLVVEPPGERPQVRSPRDAARLLLPNMGHLDHEQVRVLLLDTANRLIVALTLYRGTVCECRVRVAEVFREAVRSNATALVVAHNHPGGSSDPSPEDVRLTSALVQAGRLLDIDVLDHLIVGSLTRYTSLRERGLGWE